MQKVSGSKPQSASSDRIVIIICTLVLTLCALGAGLRSYQNWRAADGSLDVQRAASASAGRVRAQALQTQAALQRALEEFARTADAGAASAPLRQARLGFVVFQSGGQPAMASDASAVAPARAGLAAAQAAGRAVLLAPDRGGVLLIAVRKSDYGAVALLNPDLGASPYSVRIIGPASRLEIGDKTAPLGLGGLLVAARDGQAWTRWLLFGVDAALCLTPLAGALVLLQNWRRQRRTVTALTQDLEQAKRRFRVAVNGARAGVFEYSAANNGVFQFSARLRAMLNAQADQLGASAFLGLVTEGDRPNVVAALDRAAESGVLELAFHIAARPAAIIEMRGLAIDGGEGEGLRFVGTALDDTPRREAESRASMMERRLRAAIEGYNGPFALWDAKRRLVTCNASYLKAFQLSGHAKPNSPYEVLAAASLAAIRQQRHDEADPHLREIELVSGQWFQVIERVTPDGGLVTVGTNITPLKEHERALTSSARDMRTTLAQLARSEGRNRELAKKYEEEKLRAEDASRAKSAFLANMSHELRTPLNAIVGYGELLLETATEDHRDADVQDLNRVLAASTHLLTLINDLLDLSRVEAGKLVAQFDAIPLLPLLNEVAATVAPAVAKRNNRLQCGFADDLGLVVTDSLRLSQCLLNLLSNAAKFTQDGTICLSAHREIIGQRAWLSFAVTDTGCGMAADQLDRIFEPFVQADNSSALMQGGAGLGLAITRQLAHLLGGEITVRSTPGAGTSFLLRIPADPTAAAPSTAKIAVAA